MFDCRSGTTTLRGDPGRLRQVVTNLLGNAIRYTHQGEVRVSVQLDADPRSGFATLKLAVTDTGPGIPEHELERIFERFHRADATAGGAGLGLAITRTLVRSMGGSIEVRSRVGVGSRFVVRIPLPIVSWQDSSRRSLASRRLLVIDDHPERLAATARLLESAGAEVLACDGGAALDAIASDEPLHTVLVDRDVSLPDTLARLVARARPDASLVLLDAAGRPLEGDAFPQRVLRPLTERGLAEIAGAATPAVSHVVGGPLAARVLVVDDASDGRLLARGLLEQAGLRVVEAASGEEAVAIAARQPVDVVLMDVSMPGIGGIEAARRIRARPGAPPVVALTAHATDAVRQSCQAAGMDGFVTKPITGRRLLAAVAEHASLGPAVLVVDDDPDARRLTAAWLGTVPGLRLIEAVTGEQAVELARSRDFDVVLMDLELPGIGGEEATKRIHALPGRSDLPILGLTAHSGSEVRRRCVAAGMCDQVSKPLRREELVRVVCAVAGLSVVASHRVVDPDIADLVPAYLDARRSDLAALEADLDAGRYDAVARLGHQLKGTGAPFGFPEITEIGGRLEQAALARDSTTVLHAARELGRVLGRA